MKNRYLIVMVFLCINCSSDEKPIEVVVNDIERGAIIRTLSVNYAEFHPGDLSSTFNVDLEEQDLEDGDLLNEIDVYIRFLDNTTATGNSSTQEVFYKTFTTSDFTIGPDDLPRTNLSISYQEALDATGMTEGLIECKDQFLVRLDLKLTDGRSFSYGDSSSDIIAFDTFFSSPFCYTINVVEPIPEDAFTGVYDMESLVNSARLDVPVFTEVEEDFSALIALFEIRKGHSTNTRVFDAFYANGHRGGERVRTFEFTVACDEIIFQKNQFTSYRSACTFQDPTILLGPSDNNGTANPNDDTVFIVPVLEGYLGFDGGCGFGSHEAIVKFSKQ